MEKIIVQGSSRNDGNTFKIVQILQEQLECELLNLSNYVIHQYDYEHNYENDDFLNIMNKIVQYDLIILASPIYWYTMSGTMKTFLDRITDCLKIEKELGRKLRGKYKAVISCGSDSTIIPSFYVPFKNSADYLGIYYIDELHTWINKTDLPTDEVKDLIKEFVKRLNIIENR